MQDIDFVREFLVESHENLDRLSQDLIALENDPHNRETLASVFRTIHTIKGTSGLLAFNKLEAVAHVGESLLARLRDGLTGLTPEITTQLLAMVDAIRQMLESIEATGQEGERSDEKLIDALTRLLADRAEKPHFPPSESHLKPEASPRRAIETCEVTAGQREAGDSLEEKARSAEDTGSGLSAQPQDHRPGANDSTIRVDVCQLDRLMNLVGELVLLRNQIVQFTGSSDDADMLGAAQRLNLLTTELQESVMKTRMQPIGNIWNKFPRIVRDLALACGKQIRIEMEGEGTELDRTIIEAIKDPLTHLVRNAADHGIESPEARKAAGKDLEGRLFLRAFHEGGQVNIEITDDGRGLDSGKIRDKAVQNGLIGAEQAARMSEREMVNLIFLPGFSTAEKITNVSGRGVGMDVVKTNIEKIGGTVDVHSTPGRGATVRMKIPLTLAIIPALIVTSAGDRYAIPQVNLLELVRLEKGIELVNGAPVCRLRGRLLPLVSLNRALGVGSSSAQETPDANIVVLQADHRQFGLVVDEINDTEEIVVKPLGKQLKGINAYAGATIMGDGNVALILDVLGLAQRANLVGETRERPMTDRTEKSLPGVADGNKRSAVLLFRHGDAGNMAVDLSSVARLEEFSPDAIELAGGREAVQYRGEIMPLLRVSEVLPSRRQNAGGNNQEALHVVVYARNGKNVGLVVDRILDIVEESFVIQRRAGRRGIAGSAVIQQRITDILDVPDLIAAAEHNDFSEVNFV